eukprot:3901954-Rhodomonas_salina.5
MASGGTQGSDSRDVEAKGSDVMTEAGESGQGEKEESAAALGKPIPKAEPEADGKDEGQRDKETKEDGERVSAEIGEPKGTWKPVQRAEREAALQQAICTGTLQDEFATPKTLFQEMLAKKQREAQHAADPGRITSDDEESTKVWPPLREPTPLYPLAADLMWYIH